MIDFATAYTSGTPAEVDFTGTVSGKATQFVGAHGRHEVFPVTTASGPVQIIDNIDIAPPVDVHPGDAIEVRGEMVHDPGTMPVVHWTHHDPSHRHADGFIRLHDRLYA